MDLPQAKPNGQAKAKALFQMMGVFAEFEREMIRERVAAGLDRARAKGKKLGRPSIGARVEHKIREGHTAGKSKRAIARELGISDGTVRKVLASEEARLVG